MRHAHVTLGPKHEGEAAPTCASAALESAHNSSEANTPAPWLTRISRPVGVEREEVKGRRGIQQAR